MSGGSLDYVYRQVEEAAHGVTSLAQTPLHRAFAAHLELVARALHDLEWVMSCDYAPGGEIEAIRAVVTPAVELEYARANAVKARDELNALLKE